MSRTKFWKKTVHRRLPVWAGGSRFLPASHHIDSADRLRSKRKPPAGIVNTITCRGFCGVSRFSQRRGAADRRGFFLVDNPLESIALAVDGLFALQIEGIVSVGHQALLVGLHGLGEDLEVSLSEAAITQGT